jgi:hypothetical protein
MPLHVERGVARFHPRPRDPDDGPRVVVRLGPRENFIQPPEEAERRIGAPVARLDARQVQRLCATQAPVC